MKRSEALLGSNLMRDSAVMRKRKMSGPGGRSLLYLRIAIPCQEKPTNKPLAVFRAHPTMVIQILLQVGEHALDLVVGVRHSLTAWLLVCEQVRQEEVYAVHGSSEPFVGVS